MAMKNHIFLCSVSKLLIIYIKPHRAHEEANSIDVSSQDMRRYLECKCNYINDWFMQKEKLVSSFWLARSFFVVRGFSSAASVAGYDFL